MFSSRLTSLYLALAATASLGFLISAADAGGDKKPAKWTPEAVLKLKKISGVQVSPDAKRVVYTVTEAVIDDGASEYRSHLYLANFDGSDTFQFTQGDKSCDSPQWSPDGKRIAFLSNRAGKRDIWLIRLQGGEAERLTDVKTGVSAFKWAPDSNSIAFTAVDGKTADEEKAVKNKDDARVVDKDTKMVRLYVIPLARDAQGKRDAKLLTRGDYSVGGVLAVGHTFDWSPDSKTIAFTRTKSPAADHWPSADIWVISLGDLQMWSVAATGAAEMSPLYSPDGKWIACVASDNPPTWPRSFRAQLIPAKGGKAKWLADTHDQLPNLVGWSKDGSRIYYTEAFYTMSRLDSLTIDGKAQPTTGLAQAVLGDVNLNATRTAFGLTRQSLTYPQEAFVSSVNDLDPKRISSVNQDLTKLALGKTEVIQWLGKGNTEIEGLLTYPVGYEKGKRYPLLLVIHGGPAGVYSQTFIGNAYPYPVAALAAEGYAVLRCNPRGSTGYGWKFRYANVKDWGGGDYQDLMAGVDKVIKLGVADEKRLGVMGWSYGGFMTSWTITQTKRFKAASVGAGVTNLVSMTGTSDVPSTLPSYFGGEFWDNPGVYEKHSAMFHVKNVTTPTLIQHGDKDDRVPVSQGYEFYNALKRQGCPVTMVVYPRMPHGPAEPRQLVDIMKRNVEWMDKYVK